MNLNSISKRIDLIGISILTLFIFLSLAFRASAISFMDPGFPILRENDWVPKSPISFKWNENHWNERPKRLINDEFSEVSYTSRFIHPFTVTSIEPTAFFVIQNLSRYSANEYALSELQNNYHEYINALSEHETLITEIPDFNFSSQADKYYIWCTQRSADDKTTFNPVDVGACYYWAVYGKYYSEIRLSMTSRGGGRQFSIELFTDVLNHADTKLTNAQE